MKILFLIQHYSRFIAVVLFLFAYRPSYAQVDTSHVFWIDFTPHSFVNAGMISMEVNPLYMDANYQMMPSPSLDLTYVRDYNKWRFGVGGNLMLLRSKLFLNWKPSGRVNELIDGIYSINQHRNGLHLLVAYTTARAEFSLKLAVSGTFEEVRDSTFKAYTSSQEMLGSGIFRRTSVDTDFKWFTHQARQSIIKIEGAYLVTTRLGLGMNSMFWLNGATNFSLNMKTDVFLNSTAVDSFDAANIRIRQPKFQLGFFLRYKF